MIENDVRHTLHVSADVASVADTTRSTSAGGAVVDLHSAGATFHELRLITALPHETAEVLAGLSQARIVYRLSSAARSATASDVFYLEDPAGLTIHLLASDGAARACTEKVGEHATQRRHKAGAWDGSYDESIAGAAAWNWLAAATGASLLHNSSIAGVPAADSFATIERCSYAVWHDASASAAALLRFLLKSHGTLLKDALPRAASIEVSLDVSKGQTTVRVMSGVRGGGGGSDATIELPGPATKKDRVELGIVARQRRQLRDTEIRGMSTYLPKLDFKPFVIFYDQQLRPDSAMPGDAAVRHQVVGRGSHLKMTSSWSIPVANSSHFADLQRLAEQGCRFYGMYTLPKSHFFDRYELARHFPALDDSNGDSARAEAGLSEPSFALHGEQHLEAPEWSVRGWGSILLLSLSASQMAAEDEIVSVPMHGRYLSPTTGGAPQRRLLQPPVFFHACPLSDAAFDDDPWRTTGPSLLRRLFDDTTELRVFEQHAWQDGAQVGKFTTTLPVANAAQAQNVAWITIATILLGAAYIVLRALRRPPKIPGDAHATKKMQ